MFDALNENNIDDIDEDDEDFKNYDMSDEDEINPHGFIYEA